MSASADLLVTNANLLTMNRAHARATAMAVRGGVIVHVGDERSVASFIGSDTHQLDLDGKTVVPGFHDCHLHLLWYGRSLVAEADLVGSASIDDVLDRLSTFARRSDGWIRGHGFDQDKLAEGRFPTRADLDQVSRTRPIVITRVCGHAAIVNSAALALVDPAERAAGDAETGLFTEGSISAFHRRVPPLDEATLERAVLAACEVALRSGITSVQTLLDTVDQVHVYTRLRAKLGRLPIRMTVMPPQDSLEVMHSLGLPFGAGDAWLRVGGAKFFSDGSLGARTALLEAPYADDPSAGLGLRIYPADVLKRRCAEVAEEGWQLVIHAIGDAALRESIDAIEGALAGSDNGGPRHRIEHASVCPPDHLERLARLKIATTLQPQFITSDTWTGQRLGPARTPWAYPFRSMLRAGVPVGLSSDCPVETLDAFACLAAAVGRHSWVGEAESLTPLEAIEAYTIGSAYMAHREHEVGSLEAGKLADFVVLSADPSAMNADAIRSLRAEQVFVAGVEATTA
jgi:predicted amidohydrolase YtcJ